MRVPTSAPTRSARPAVPDATACLLRLGAISRCPPPRCPRLGRLPVAALPSITTTTPPRPRSSSKSRPHAQPDLGRVDRLDSALLPPATSIACSTRSSFTHVRAALVRRHFERGFVVDDNVRVRTSSNPFTARYDIASLDGVHQLLIDTGHTWSLFAHRPLDPPLFASRPTRTPPSERGGGRRRSRSCPRNGGGGRRNRCRRRFARGGRATVRSNSLVICTRPKSHEQPPSLGNRPRQDRAARTRIAPRSTVVRS